MKKVDGDKIMSWWMEQYHGKTIKQVVEGYNGDIPEDWWDDYMVTQEQYDEWVEWVKGEMKAAGYSNKYIERKIGWVELECGPKVKQ